MGSSRWGCVCGAPLCLRGSRATARSPCRETRAEPRSPTRKLLKPGSRNGRASQTSKLRRYQWLRLEGSKAKRTGPPPTEPRVQARRLKRRAELAPGVRLSSARRAPRDRAESKWPAFCAKIRAPTCVPCQIPQSAENIRNAQIAQIENGGQKCGKRRFENGGKWW